MTPPPRRRITVRALLAPALALLLVFAPLGSAGASLAGRPPAQPGHAHDRILVGFKPGTSAVDSARAHAALGTGVQARIPRIGVEAVTVPRGRSVEGLLRAYLRNPHVAFAEPDYIVEAQSTPNDPLYSAQWGLPAVNAPAAWEVTTGSETVTIAVLDTGIDHSHPDLAGRIVDGYDVVNRDDHPGDDHGHGTMVAGIAAADGDNGAGIAGVDWNARIMPVKVLDSSGSGYMSWVAEGIVRAADSGAQVINMSLSGPSGSAALSSAIDHAYSRGTSLVAGTGNNGAEAIGYPAAYPKVIAVGSLSGETLSVFSNYGAGLSLVAPGGAIYTTRLGGTYVRVSGTSMSTPFVAGLAATLYGLDPSLTPGRLESILQETATDLGEPGFDIRYGHGRIDMAAAVSAVSDQRTSPDPDPGPTPDPPPGPQPDPGPDTPPARDTTPPSIRITSPAADSMVSGTVTVAAVASDDTGVARVDFYLDGSLLGSSTSEPFTVRWNTRKATGSHALTAIARDAAGNSTTSSAVHVTVGSTTVGKPPKK